MDGLGLLPGELAHALGRPAGGRRQEHLLPRLLQQVDDGVEGGGLAGAGPAGEQQHALLHGRPDGLLLLVRVADAPLLLNLPDLHVRPAQRAGGHAEHGLHPGGDVRLAQVLLLQEEKGLSPDLLPPQGQVLAQLVDGVLHQLLLHLKGGGRRRPELVLGQAGVAVVQVVPEHVQHPGLQPPPVVPGLLHRLRDAVRHGKAQPDLRVAQAVGVLLDAAH